MTEQQRNLEITGDAKPNVPVFTCLIYVRTDDDGMVAGRVANLADLEASGSSERGVLGKLVGDFKLRVSKLLADGQEIPWIDPPLPQSENEQIRSVPMHL